MSKIFLKTNPGLPFDNSVQTESNLANLLDAETLDKKRRLKSEFEQ